MDKKNAIVYSEALFGKMDGKTANGLVRYSETYNIIGVIDSTKASLDAGYVLDEITNNIQIYTNLDEAIKKLSKKIDVFIYGIAPLSGDFSDGDIELMYKAMDLKMDIVNGMHTFLTDNLDFMKKAKENGVKVIDIRKYKGKNFKRIFTGDISKVTAPRIAILGTDGAIGKRTTATIITQSLKQKGINAVMICTGQTGLIQGGKYGAPMDAIQGHFATGVIEGEILRAWEEEKPDIFIIEGQGAMSHPAYLSSCAISRGSQIGGIVLQHAPTRKVLGDYPDIAMPTVEFAIKLNELFTSSSVIAITINHENMNDKELDKTIVDYENIYKLPTTDVIKYGADKIVKCLVEKFDLKYNI
jgi:uncharacterized NAD-dependent epimerase/dehydratase family protein